jgi:hypothetical protein
MKKISIIKWITSIFKNMKPVSSKKKRQGHFFYKIDIVRDEESLLSKILGGAK